jgi:hypothetical protein
MKFFKRKPQQPWHEEILDQELYTIPETNEAITWADSLESTLILGGTGSGKTSAIAKYVGKAMLAKGFGMVIFCVKKEERERWETYIQETGRTNDKIVFNKQSGLQFNFLQHEIQRQGEGRGDIINIINVLMNLSKQTRVYQGGGSLKNEEEFWDNAIRRLITRVLMLLVLSNEEVSIYNMRKMVSEHFDHQEVNRYLKLTRTMVAGEDIDIEEKEEAKEEFRDWKESSFFLKALDTVVKLDTEDAEIVKTYWLKDFVKLAERTKSTILESFFGMVEPFISSTVLKEQFSKGLSEELIPENIIYNKKILIVDYAVKELGISSIFASIIYKNVFQAACERRNIRQENNPKPVGLFIDEYQNYCNPIQDSLFQSTARSSWVSCVYVTQNINNLFFVMGSDQPEARAKSFLSNLNLKYLANNSDSVTNSWVSEMIGKEWIDVASFSDEGDRGIKKSVSYQYHHKVNPDFFTTLKTGRAKNNFKVQCVVFKSGRLWGVKKQNYTLVEFSQI